MSSYGTFHEIFEMSHDFNTIWLAGLLTSPPYSIPLCQQLVFARIQIPKGSPCTRAYVSFWGSQNPVNCSLGEQAKNAEPNNSFNRNRTCHTPLILSFAQENQRQWRDRFLQTIGHSKRGIRRQHHLARLNTRFRSLPCLGRKG